MTLRTPRLLFAVVCSLPSLSAADYFGIQVVDDATDRGVPLVELKTVNGIRLFTDSAGKVAFNEPGLMGQDVFFHVSSHGYEFPADGFGIRGRRLKVTAGGRVQLRVTRKNIAERLYRITGAGIYRDSELLNDPTPLKHPVLNGKVLGSDSVMTALFKGRVYWFWGDTNRPSYPLGNFQVPGAVTDLPASDGLSPRDGINLQYFVDDDGFASETCRMEGQGPTWIDGLLTVGEGEDERMFAHYVKIKPPLSVYRSGIVEFNDQTKRFEHRVELDLDSPLHPSGHAFRHNDRGTDYIYFANPYPVVRVPADADAIMDATRYEAWSYFPEGVLNNPDQIDRDADGKVVLGWKRNTHPVDLQLEKKLLRQGSLQDSERYFQMTDAESQRTVIAHRGSVAFNKYRNRWIMIFTEHFGEASVLGEVWYAEADAPTGPWKAAVHIVTHDQYSFYNPKHHPLFDQDDGRRIFFEGTYTHTFSGNKDQTPRYDYNQIMYSLDLTDPRLRLE